MCNAWNHPWNCTCGWGGPGHLGRRSGGGSVFRAYMEATEHGPTFAPSNSVWRYRDDFCAPTKCPRCEEAVYFIRHNGGSVWVDHLGWPWPKHRCFDERRSGEASWMVYFRTHVPVVESARPPGVGLITHAVWAHEGDGKPARILLGIDFGTDGKVCLATTATNTISYLRGRLAVLDLENEVLFTSNHERRPILDVEVESWELGLGTEWTPVRGQGRWRAV